MGSVDPENIVKVPLGKFACTSLEARFRGDPRSGLQVALFHYARRLKSGRRPVALPRFQVKEHSAEPPTVFDLLIDPDVRAVLEDEADKNGMPLSDVLAHAVFVYLADMDATGDIGSAGGAGAGSAPAAHDEAAFRSSPSLL